MGWIFNMSLCPVSLGDLETYTHLPSIMPPEETTLTIDVLPPGTQRINDLQATHIVLAPRPTSDPNQPLV